MTRLANTTNPLIDVPPNGYEPRHLFAVISWGCAATTWAAKALNSHPEIIALHHGNLGLGLRGTDGTLDGVDYMWKLAYDGTGYSVAGDVHGVSRFLIPEIRTAFGDEFSSAVLVREPIPRLASLLAHLDRSRGKELFDLTYVDALVEAKRLDLPDASYQTKLFVHAANLLNAVIEEREVGPIYASERVTADPEVFRAFVEHLTGGHVTVEAGWVQDVLRTGRVNVHARGGTEFSDWQRSVIERLVEPEAREIYAGLGYRSIEV